MMRKQFLPLSGVARGAASSTKGCAFYVQLALILTLLLLRATDVSAQASGSVEHDTWVDSSPTNYDDNGQLRMISTNAGASCTAAIGTLIQKDVSLASGPTVGTVTLDVVVNNNAVGGSVTLELFEATADFNETTAVGPLSGWVGPSLNSTVNLDASTPAGATLTFPSSAALVAYVQNAMDGDGNASFLIQMTSCPVGGHTLDLDERETGTAPVLNLQSPTAVHLVSMGTTHTAQTNMRRLFIAGVILLGAVTAVLRVRARRHTVDSLQES